MPSKLSDSRKRSKKGSTLGLVAACVFLVIIALAAAFQLMMYLGSSQELKNSVDAASLNVAMKANEIKINAIPDWNYSDVADCSGKYSIANINRVWGKCFLIAANGQEMLNQGQQSATSETNVAAMYSNATIINNKLYDLLLSGAANDVAFNQMTAAKPAKLMQNGGGVQSSHDEHWSTACLYRGEESNLKMDPDEMPNGTGAPSIKAGSQIWLQGYNPMLAHEKKYTFTTFHTNEAPHLISTATFDKWKNSPVNGAETSPIPNTFKQAGALNGPVNLQASAVAVANPQISYWLQIPQAYVVIAFQNTADWYVQGARYKHTLYSPSTGKTWVVKSRPLSPPAKGILNGYATLGNEYKGDVYSAMNAIPGDKTQAMVKLLQRIKEMRPGYTQKELVSLLKGIQYPPNASTLDVVIYADDKCNTAASNKLPQLQTCEIYIDEQNQTHATGVPQWIGQQPEGMAEGTEQKIFNEPALVDSPNFCWSNIIGPYPTDKHSATETGVCTWKPGTGTLRNLGVIKFYRNVNIQFTGMP